jgi:divalent metal cation (Fe/Co/Zn/Cd) transporter
MIQRGLKSSLIGIGFNLVLALFKCTTGFIGHSFALIADGIESLSDVICSTVVMYYGVNAAGHFNSPGVVFCIGTSLCGPRG